MKIFYDTEFIDDGRTIDLISIGMWTETDNGLYLENADCALSRAGDWVKLNVVPHLTHDPHAKASYKQIAAEVRRFVEQHLTLGKVELWGYYSAYDHVALCQLFGAMVDLPPFFPKYTHDLKQWCDELGNPKLPPQKGTEHNALCDAIWNHQAWNFLNGLTNDVD